MRLMRRLMVLGTLSVLGWFSAGLPAQPTNFLASPTLLEFPVVARGGSAQQDLRVLTSGFIASGVRVDCTFVSSDPAFSVSSATLSIPVGQQSRVTVTYTPGAVGPITAVIMIEAVRATYGTAPAPYFVEPLGFISVGVRATGAGQPAELQIVTPPGRLPNGAERQGYLKRLEATGGTLPYRWTVTSCNLPPGLVLDSTTGFIFGVPKKAGIYRFRVALVDASPRVVRAGNHIGQSIPSEIEYEQVIGSPTDYPLEIITETPLPPGKVRTPYPLSADNPLQVVPGGPGYTWTIVPGGFLPAGLRLQRPDGLITGVPELLGRSFFLVEVSNRVGTQTAQKAFRITIDPADRPPAAGPLVEAAVEEPLLQSTAPDPLIPQIANGAGFSTEFRIFNLTDATVSFVLSFFDDRGQPLSLPLAEALGGEQTLICGDVAAQGAFIRQTVPGGPLKSGYAVLSTADPRALAVNTIYTQLAPGRRPFQTAVPLMGALGQFRIPFVNSRARELTTTLAWVNRDASEVRVTAVARRADGQALRTDDRASCEMQTRLSPGQHEAFELEKLLPCSKNNEGTLDVEAEPAGVVAIGFLFHDRGPFTTNLPAERSTAAAERALAAQVPRPDMLPQIAAGPGFTTEFQILNLSDAPARFRLNFLNRFGGPLALPLTRPDGRLGEEETELFGAVPARGVLFRRTYPGGDLKSGYAVLETDDPQAVAVTALFTQEAPASGSFSAEPFQTAIPLRKGFTRFRLPFSNSDSRGLTTALAWVNCAPSPRRVTVIARSNDGVEVCRREWFLTSLAHEAFNLEERLPCTSDLSGLPEGLLDVVVDAPGVAVIGLLFQDSGPFTTNLPVEILSGP